MLSQRIFWQKENDIGEMPKLQNNSFIRDFRNVKCAYDHSIRKCLNELFNHNNTKEIEYLPQFLQITAVCNLLFESLDDTPHEHSHVILLLMNKLRICTVFSI